MMRRASLTSNAQASRHFDHHGRSFARFTTDGQSELLGDEHRVLKWNAPPLLATVQHLPRGQLVGRKEHALPHLPDAAPLFVPVPPASLVRPAVGVPKGAGALALVRHVFTAVDAPVWVEEGALPVLFAGREGALVAPPIRVHELAIALALARVPLALIHAAVGKSQPTVALEATGSKVALVCAACGQRERAVTVHVVVVPLAIIDVTASRGVHTATLTAPLAPLTVVDRTSGGAEHATPAALVALEGALVDVAIGGVEASATCLAPPAAVWHLRVITRRHGHNLAARALAHPAHGLAILLAREGARLGRVALKAVGRQRGQQQRGHPRLYLVAAV
eukprot:scaffold67931_cov32-Tisochrysis_lutea.AAC.2